MAKPLMDVLNGKLLPVPPIWLMRQAGRYLPEYREVRAKAGDFLALCYNPGLAAEVTLQPIRRFGLDAAIIFADILLVPHALGQSLRFAEGEGPLLDPIESAEALNRLSLTGLTQRLGPVYDAVSRVRAALPEPVTLIGFAGAPWTVATYMAEGRGSPDQKAARLWAYRDPERFAELIRLLEAATVEHLAAQVAAGAEVVQLFDTWAGTLDEKGFERWVVEPTARIVEALRERCSSVRIIGFPRGAGARLGAYVTKTKIDAVSLDFTVPTAWARDTVPETVVLQGNLDPLALVAGGETLREATQAILETWAGRRFIFNLGHGIVPETPPAHVATLVRQVRGG